MRREDISGEEWEEEMVGEEWDRYKRRGVKER